MIENLSVKKTPLKMAKGERGHDPDWEAHG
jgi:hypothetical protein